MSATTERLLEEIERTENALLDAQARGDNLAVEGCNMALQVMKKRLIQANEALNESKQTLLKG